ncbi:hypothetical protein [Geminisphaera colitermitum]|uniref:primosomal protein N' family DNA-binding protein n=1 Tax=Geminisphaera colitermitum TaxID=1148786 RepID=UPI001E4AA04E|nr:hypothetical protein [Geminisphaera colitermitum]
MSAALATTGKHPATTMMTVGVHPLAGFDKLLHYRAPESLREQAQVGMLVRVPILNGLRLGIVGEMLEIGEGGGGLDFPVEKLKTLSAFVYPFPALPPDLLQLARWMAGYYAAPLDGIIETMLPAAVRHAAGLKYEKYLSLAAPPSPPPPPPGHVRRAARCGGICAARTPRPRASEVVSVSS